MRGSGFRKTTANVPFPCRNRTSFTDSSAGGIATDGFPAAHATNAFFSRVFCFVVLGRNTGWTFGFREPRWSFVRDVVKIDPKRNPNVQTPTRPRRPCIESTRLPSILNATRYPAPCDRLFAKPSSERCEGLDA